MNKIIWGNCLRRQRLDFLELEVHSFSDFCEIWNRDGNMSGPLFSWSNCFFCPHLLFCLFSESCLLVCEMLNFCISITATWINWFVAELLHQKKRGTKIISHLDGFFFSETWDWLYVMWNTVWPRTIIFGFLILIQRAIRNLDAQKCWRRGIGTDRKTQVPIICVLLPYERQFVVFFAFFNSGGDRMF